MANGATAPRAAGRGSAAAGAAVPGSVAPDSAAPGAAAVVPQSPTTLRRPFLLASLMVAFLASGNFLLGIGNPHGAIWDESYYLTSTQRYEEGVAQFASHPPLGLMLIAAGDAALRANSKIDTTAPRPRKASG